METLSHSLNESGTPAPKEVHMVLCVWWISFLFCFLGEMFFSLFMFLFIYISRVRGKHEVKCGGIWKCWGRGILINIYCMENFKKKIIENTNPEREEKKCSERN